MRSLLPLVPAIVIAAGCSTEVSSAVDFAAADLSTRDLAAPDLAIDDLSTNDLAQPAPDLAVADDLLAPSSDGLPSACAGDPCIVALVAAFNVCFQPSGACAVSGFDGGGAHVSCRQNGASITSTAGFASYFSTYAAPDGSTCASTSYYEGGHGVSPSSRIVAGGHTWNGVYNSVGFPPTLTCDGAPTACDLGSSFPPSYSCPGVGGCP